MSPRSARLRFRFRVLTNILAVVGIFVILVLVLTAALPMLVADGIAIAAAWYLYYFILDKRAIGIRCNHCLKYIATNTPWVCGFCQARNQRVAEFPFVHQCEHCEAEPKAYQCHHCEHIIFLTADQLTENYARCVSPPVGDIAKDEMNLQEREKRKMEHELLMTRLTGELTDAKRKVEPPKKVAPLEKLEEDFSRHHATVMGAREIARREKAANVEKYKDDPAGRKDADDAVDDWLRRHI